jgi:hypothetical protein
MSYDLPPLPKKMKYLEVTGQGQIIRKANSQQQTNLAEAIAKFLPSFEAAEGRAEPQRNLNYVILALSEALSIPFCCLFHLCSVNTVSF